LAAFELTPEGRIRGQRFNSESLSKRPYVANVVDGKAGSSKLSE
jgi:hypothetical protein